MQCCCMLPNTSNQQSVQRVKCMCPCMTLHGELLCYVAACWAASNTRISDNALTECRTGRHIDRGSKRKRVQTCSLLGPHPVGACQSRVAQSLRMEHWNHLTTPVVTLMHHLLVQALPECAKNVWGGTEAVQEAVSKSQVSSKYRKKNCMSCRACTASATMSKHVVLGFASLLPLSFGRC